MANLEIIPDWLWLVLAASIIVFMVLMVLNRRQRNVRKRRRKAAAIRHIAHLKAWRWLHGQPKTKRIAYRKPDDQGRDS